MRLAILVTHQMSGSMPVEGKSADAAWTSRMPGFIVTCRALPEKTRRPGSLPMVRSDSPTRSEVVDVVVTGRLDRFQRKHRWAGFPLAVAYKYFDDFGAYLAALLTYYGFVSLFPLLLLLSTILGFVLSGDPRLQHEVLTSALHQFPVSAGTWPGRAPRRRPGRPHRGDRRVPLRRAGSGASFPVREQHHVGSAAQQPAEPLQGPRSQPAHAGRRRVGHAWARPSCLSRAVAEGEYSGYLEGPWRWRRLL